MSVRFKLVVEVDGAEVHVEHLSGEMTAGVLGRVYDAPESRALHALFALSPSAEVRQEVASRDHLTEETVVTLAGDSSINVRRTLCGQSPFREWASTEIVLDYIRADAECARIIAGAVGDYGNADGGKLAAELRAHPDPEVRLALASGWSTPRKVLKDLLKDTDSAVRITAGRTLD